MRDKQLRKIYTDALAALGRRDPDEDQYEAWKKALLQFEEADVRAALDSWQGDTEQIEMFGTSRARGSFMPTQADIKARVLATLRKRKESLRFAPCNKTTRNGQCADGIYLYRTEDGKTFSRDCDCYREYKRNREGVAA